MNNSDWHIPTVRLPQPRDVDNVPEWFTETIDAVTVVLLSANLNHRPAGDMVDHYISVLAATLWRAREWHQGSAVRLLSDGVRNWIAHSSSWPTPKEMLDAVPRPKPQMKDSGKRTPEGAEKGYAMLKRAADELLSGWQEHRPKNKTQTPIAQIRCPSCLSFVAIDLRPDSRKEWSGQQDCDSCRNRVIVSISCDIAPAKNIDTDAV